MPTTTYDDFVTDFGLVASWNM